MTLPFQTEAADANLRALFEKVSAKIAATPFFPHRILKQADAQTLSGHFWPGRYRSKDRSKDEARLFEVEPGSRVLAHCRWQPNRSEQGTLVMWHGMEGSTRSAYMMTTANKAFQAGLNVVRVNVRNCGETEHLSPTLYHGGLTSDLHAVVDELIARDRLSRIFVGGFSLGGNMALKLAGEYGDHPPPEVKAICAVSPSTDMRASIDLLMQRRNWLYHQDFLHRLRKRVRIKEKLFPDLYDSSGLRRIRSIEQFDNRYIAPMFGFADADDYYAKASALPLIGRIRIPTLIIHAKDDPFVPFAPLRNPAIAMNPYVMLLATERGGHVAFMAADSSGEDRFWAENRLVDFCGLVTENPFEG